MKRPVSGPLTWVSREVFFRTSRRLQQGRSTVWYIRSQMCSTSWYNILSHTPAVLGPCSAIIEQTTNSFKTSVVKPHSQVVVQPLARKTLVMLMLCALLFMKSTTRPKLARPARSPPPLPPSRNVPERQLASRLSQPASNACSHGRERASMGGCRAGTGMWRRSRALLTC